MTKICVFGAGAIGGYLACSLIKTSADISLIARGPHKEAIEKNGLKLIKGNIEETHKIYVTDNPSDLPIQDFIFLGVKAHSISGIIDSLLPIIGDNTSIISAVNGLPWWYFYKTKTGTVLDDCHIESVDPGGRIWNKIGAEKAIGCVVYPACEIVQPGVIKHFNGDRFSLGEPAGINSERLKQISELLISGGLKAPQKKNLRNEIWIKLWGNCSFNIVSALTGTTLDELGQNVETLNLIRKLMTECQNVAENIGIKFNISLEHRINGAISIIGHKPSTTQDLEANKPLEIDPIIGSIIEISNKLNIETPTLKTINTLIKLKAETLGLYQRSNLIDKMTL